MFELKIYGPTFSSFVRAVRILCQYKGLSYEVTDQANGQPVEFFSEQQRELHPFKKVPVLIDGNFVLPETGAIARYLDTLPGPALYPDNNREYALVDAMASLIGRYVDHYLVRRILLEFSFPKGENGQVRIDNVNAALPEAKRTIRWLASVIGSKKFVIGDHLTPSDAFTLPMLDYMRQLPSEFNLVESFENLGRYLDWHKKQPYCEGILGPRS